MTPEQRKRVAEIITGQKWKVVPWRPVNPEHNRDMILLDGKAGWNKDNQWDPKFEGQDWQRSQALAVVEWLFGNTTGIGGGIHSCGLVDRIYEAINDKDTEPLLSLVLELSDEM